MINWNTQSIMGVMSMGIFAGPPDAFLSFMSGGLYSGCIALRANFS
jgi:hypothetical protein